MMMMKEIDHVLTSHRSLSKSLRVYQGAEAAANTNLQPPPRNSSHLTPPFPCWYADVVAARLIALSYFI